MKKMFKVLFGAVVLLTGTIVRGQDSTKHSAATHISKGSENADNLYGKKIQQQTLSNKRFQKLATIAPKPLKKKSTKRKHG